MVDEINFTKRQEFTQWWIWLILIETQQPDEVENLLQALKKKLLKTNNMKPNIRNSLFILGFLFFCSLCFSQNNPKVLFIIADGIPADVIEAHPAPAMKSIAVQGSYIRAFVGGEKGGETESPTISAVGYNSLLTGTWANKHNVWDNDIDKPNYRYPTIFRLFKNQYPEKKIGIFSTWLDNRTKLVGEGLKQTNKLEFDFVSDGHELDTIAYPHDKENKYIHLIDERVVADASDAIMNHAPDLSWVYLEYTDDMGHKWGDGPQLHQAINYLDAQIKKLWDAIQHREQQFNEDWLVVITTDHGRDSTTGRDHGGQSERERTTWIISNKKLNPGTSPAAVVDILPTMAKHLIINIPSRVRKQLDGISFF